MSSVHSESIKNNAQSAGWRDLSWGRLMEELAEAIRFLTWLPFPGSRTAQGPSGAIALFPFVGLILGVIVAIVDWLLGFASIPAGGRSVLDIASLILLTRGLHLDGLMDASDGLLGGHSKDERLMLMRDNRVGTYAVIGCVTVLLLKVGLLDGLNGVARSASLILTPVLGRWAFALGALLFPPARPEGQAASFHTGATKSRIAIAAALTILISALTGGIIGGLAFIAVSSSVWILGNIVLESVGGMTSDTLSLLVETSEVMALLFLALAR